MSQARRERIHLLCGMPGTGKTTIIKKVVAVSDGGAGGFYTQEIRSQGVRLGFEIVTLGGEKATLAHVDIRSPYRVSKYGVDVESLEQLVIPTLYRANRECELIIIDEIGKMELLSADFRQAVWEVLEGEKNVLGTIMLPHHPWADKVKSHSSVKVVLVTRANREQILEHTLRWVLSHKLCCGGNKE